MCFSPTIGQYAENQRISAVRKVYQRGIVTPMVNIEQLWAEYCAYEKVHQILTNTLVVALLETVGLQSFLSAPFPQVVFMKAIKFVFQVA